MSCFLATFDYISADFSFGLNVFKSQSRLLVLALFPASMAVTVLHQSLELIQCQYVVYSRQCFGFVVQWLL